MENGHGGFTTDGREYVIVLDGTRETPLPWSNVLANPAFGTIVSSSGSAFTWSENSRENRLTPFANDPLTDPTAEALYVRDDDIGTVWGATPGPLPRHPDAGRWVIRHAAGVTRYQHAVAGMQQELAVFVAPHDPVKLSVLTLTNTPKQHGASACSDTSSGRWVHPAWAIGISATTEMNNGILLARNRYNSEFASAVSFWRATATPRSHTGDRADFVGHNRTLSAPAALFRKQLLGRTGAGLDPCGALQVELTIKPGESRSVGVHPRPGTRRCPRTRPGDALFVTRHSRGHAGSHRAYVG